MFELSLRDPLAHEPIWSAHAHVQVQAARSPELALLTASAEESKHLKMLNVYRKMQRVETANPRLQGRRRLELDIAAGAPCMHAGGFNAFSQLACYVSFLEVASACFSLTEHAHFCTAVVRLRAQQEDNSQPIVLAVCNSASPSPLRFAIFSLACLLACVVASHLVD